ncbi:MULTISPECIES: NUDIX hydrolase [unclassified Niallia]|uniref:NUDIX hydrolase n=1 Tax=unclassified Niallia TaxID=2837522 RepID=UPI001EDB1343|nr:MULTISPECIES: NUDIX hydrolase [unclassified Niallia]MCM3030443.1 NUDIX hydrolase [Niallia sp. MER 6]MDL0434633.1 NUDIX hydrolase [Niallia sp. SS-2023]UPO89486.1 NUDIX hydrolase [Niallia sp. Man26]
MEENAKFHRAFGVYGICLDSEYLLVIHKSQGPYRNRFDLPGGSLEEGESLAEAIDREFLEETGLEICHKENIGITDFMFPWRWREFTHVHHIAVFYEVRNFSGVITAPEQFVGQDSLGAVWMDLNELTMDNSSPLVMQAVNWTKTRSFPLKVNKLQVWEVKK